MEKNVVCSFLGTPLVGSLDYSHFLDKNEESQIFMKRKKEQRKKLNQCQIL